MNDEFIQAFLMLFVVLDAIGNAPLFYYFTGKMDPQRRRSTIRLSIIVASLILLFFMALGDLVLTYLGVNINDFRIAGGIVLFIYAVLGILGHSVAEEVSGEDIAVVPLATPLLAGPGAITVMIYIKYTWGLWTAFASLLINMVIAWFFLENGDKLLSLLGRTGSTVLSKIMAILLAAYSIAMIREGILEIMA
ncbi:MAG: MarC family protein [Desulfurococcales archaeon]|nr:MarC family protein [Desulfurococcales archaeon]